MAENITLLRLPKTLWDPEASQTYGFRGKKTNPPPRSPPTFPPTPFSYYSLVHKQQWKLKHLNNVINCIKVFLKSLSKFKIYLTSYIVHCNVWYSVKWTYQGLQKSIWGKIKGQGIATLQSFQGQLIFENCKPLTFKQRYLLKALYDQKYVWYPCS